MACSNHNARAASKLSYRKRQRRSRHQLLVNINLDSVCRKNACRSFGKNIRFNTAVIRNRYAWRRKRLVYIICKSLRRASDSIYVHSVGTGSYNASQSSCAEFKFSVKSVVNCFVVIFYVLQLTLKI